MGFFHQILGWYCVVIATLKVTRSTTRTLTKSTIFVTTVGFSSTTQAHAFSPAPSNSFIATSKSTVLTLLSNDKESKNYNSNQQEMNGNLQFGRFVIPKAHIFFRSKLSAGFVNLRPIVPGHVLVIPERIVATMEELSDDEYVDMWRSVRIIQQMLKQKYGTSTSQDSLTGNQRTKNVAFNVAVQDGREAGQTVPHVHVHILPRVSGDFERNDDVYDALENWAPREDLATKSTTSLDVPDDEDRVDRTSEMMAEEATMYRQLLSDMDGSSKL